MKGRVGIVPVIPGFFIVLFFICISSKCVPSDNRLKIINKSDQKIVVDFSRDTIFEEGGNHLIGYYLDNGIAPDDTLKRSLRGSKDAWIEYVMRSKNGKLNLFIISYDTLKSCKDFNYIKKHRLYEIEGYTLDELEENNWTIQYFQD